jgi:hypothetical protein
MAKRTARHFLAIELDVPQDGNYDTYVTITNRSDLSGSLFDTTTISDSRFNQTSARTIISNIHDTLRHIRSYSDRAVSRVQEQIHRVMMGMMQEGD